MKLRYFLAILAFAVSNCTTQSPKLQAVCVHPLITNGMPFFPVESVKFIDGVLYPTGGGYVTGAQCVFLPAEKSQ